MRTINCDRCGNFIAVDKLSVYETRPADLVIFMAPDCSPMKRVGAHADLCGDCKKSFIEWFGEDIAKIMEPEKKTESEVKSGTTRKRRKANETLA